MTGSAPGLSAPPARDKTRQETLAETAAEKRLIVVSGLSGAGKTLVLHALEDLDYSCIDNLPVGFLRPVVAEIVGGTEQPRHLLAVGIDARNRAADLARLPTLIRQFREHDISTDLVFVQASRDILLKRYSESRRRHPLAGNGRELREAINIERGILAEVINTADLIIDTSQTSIYELAETIRKRVDCRQQRSLSVLIVSASS